MTNIEGNYKFNNACYVGDDLTFKKLSEPANLTSDNKTKEYTTLDGSHIDIHNLKMIQFCGTQFESQIVDCMCDQSNFGAYKYVEEYDINDTLSQSNASLVLDKQLGSWMRDEQFKMTIQMGDTQYSDASYTSRLPIINLKITKNLLTDELASTKAHDSVFQVPEDIVNVTDHLKCSNADRCKLSEFVLIDTSPNPEYLVKVMSNSTYKGQTPIWTLNMFEHDQSVY